MVKTRRPNKKFFTLVGILAAIILTVVLVILLDPHEGDTESGSMEFELTATAVVIRDEVCVAGENYGSIIFDVDEGAYVDVGDTVAEAYRLGYSNDIMQSYLSVQADILNTQLSLQADIENSELDSMSQQLVFKQRSILDAVMGNSTNDLQTLETELDYLLAQRIDYLRNRVQPNEALNALYTAENERLVSLSTWRGDIVSAAAGNIGFYFDGYEQSLTASKLSMITADLVRSAISEATVSTDGRGTRFYRLYANDHWYLAFVTKATSPVRLVNGNTYSVVVNGQTASPSMGTVVSVNVTESGVVTILEFSGEIGDLSDIRVVSLSVGGVANGIRVRAEAITVVDGIPGITVIAGDEKKRVEVLVLAMDEEYAIVQGINGGIVAGQRYSERG